MASEIKPTEHRSRWHRYGPKNRGQRSNLMVKRGVELLLGIYHAKLAPWETILCVAGVGRFIAWRNGLRGIKRKVPARLGILDPRSDVSQSAKPSPGGP